MAKSKPAAGSGHNSSKMSDEEKADLLLADVADILAATRARDAIKAQLDDANKELGDRFRTAKIDLGKTYSRKFIEAEILGPMARQKAGLERQFEEERSFVRTAFMFVDGQGDMFPPAEMDTADEKAHWFRKGQRAGRNGEDSAAPEGCPALCRGDWDHGFSDGQAELGRAWLTRDRLKAEASFDEPETEADEEDAEFDPDAAARTLKGKGFLDRRTDAESAEAA